MALQLQSPIPAPKQPLQAHPALQHLGQEKGPEVVSCSLSSQMQQTATVPRLLGSENPTRLLGGEDRAPTQLLSKSQRCDGTFLGEITQGPHTP